MCGIAGVKRFGDQSITEAELSTLLCAIENRGNHATGIAIQNDGEGTVHVCKKDDPAWSFIAGDEYLKFIADHLSAATRTVILHTRAATQGAPFKNENNHPMFLDRTAVVHNGGISNSDTLFTRLNLPRSCETDSDIIRAILDKEGFTHEAVKLMSDMNGSAAIAAIRGDCPNQLLLARSGNPIVYADFNDKLYWASELHAIQKAVRPWVQRHGLFMREPSNGIAYHSMPDNTAYLIGPEGLEWHQEFKVCTTFRPVTYRMHDTYFNKKREWKRQQRQERKALTFVPKDDDNAKQCPKCSTVVHKRESFKKWSDYYCYRCHQGLAVLDA